MDVILFALDLLVMIDSIKEVKSIEEAGIKVRVDADGDSHL